MNAKKTIWKTLQILLPFVLSGGILYWMYRNSDFGRIDDVLKRMKWEWMLLSFIPGILAQVFRALRWQQSLTPIGERCRTHMAICAIYLSYAASLVVPRIGEFLRCAVLARKDRVSFSKSLGTVVTERAVDMIIMVLLCAAVIAYQWQQFSDFFALTGVSISTTLSRFTSTGVWVSALCAVGILLLFIVLARKLSIMRKVKYMMQGLLTGIMSVKKVHNLPLYIFYSVAIWVCYFFHYYLTFYCFDFTGNIGLAAGLVSFCTGSIAVIVPTPNGAGAWHFAVKTILVLYGLGTDDALDFALVVHSVQTLLLVALGIYGIFAVHFTPVRKPAK
jgi:glycosyltransferase 2 family protein